jgi:hypothetical protein
MVGGGQVEADADVTGSGKVDHVRGVGCCPFIGGGCRPGGVAVVAGQPGECG